MSTRELVHEIELPADPRRVFAILITPSAIRQWWSARTAIVMPEPGGTWAATWGPAEDEADYIASATFDVFEPPNRIVFANYRYFAKTGPLPFEAEFRTEFTVRPSGSGSVLCVCQAGFPADSVADEFFAGCEQGWRDTFDGIRSFVTSGGASGTS